MEDQPIQRRLAAILAADVVGYSRLMGVDEEGTLRALKALRKAIINPKITEYHGRVVKTTGDGILIEFPSVVDAVRCAVDVQRAVAEHNADVPQDKRIWFRVGINVGDVIIDGDDIYGDGVNVAARLEALSEPGGICVSQVVHDQVRDKLAFGFEDRGEQSVKNIARPVRIYRVSLGGQPSHDSTAVLTTAVPEPSRARGAKPIIVVLPFENMSRDPSADELCDGLTEDILTALSRVPWLSVISRTTSFSYKGKPVDIGQVARDLKAGFVLEGSVRRSGERVRVTAQLIETETGAHRWAQRFDRNLTDPFAIQDEIANTASATIEQVIADALSAVSQQEKHPIRAQRAMLLRVTQPDTARSIDFGRAVIRRYPSAATAYQLLAFAHWMMINCGWTEDAQRDAALSLEAAQKAVEFGERDATNYAVLGYALLASHRFDDAVSAGTKAEAINPNSANVVGPLCQVLTFAGSVQEAADTTAKFLAMSHHHFYAVGAHWAASLIDLRRHALGQALVAAKTAVTLKPDIVIGHLLASAASQLAGRSDEAAMALANARRCRSDLSRRMLPDFFPFRHAEDMERLVDALAVAGLD